VDDKIFAAGGEHVPRTWGDFSGQTGIRAVLHLSPGRPACFEHPAPAAFLWLAVADEMELDLEDRILAGRYIWDCVQSGWKVLLHSSLGLHRVRWAYVAYRIVAGHSLKATLRQVEKRPWLSPYKTDLQAWEAFWRETRRRDPRGEHGQARRDG